MEAAEAEAALITPSIKRSLNFTSPVPVKSSAPAITPSQLQVSSVSTNGEFVFIIM